MTRRDRDRLVVLKKAVKKPIRQSQAAKELGTRMPLWRWVPAQHRAGLVQEGVRNAVRPRAAAESASRTPEASRRAR
jgi:hypothetical protein